MNNNSSSIIALVEKLLGRSNKLRNQEYAFHCTFCNHHKKKLQINLNSFRWHCWVCGTGGHNLKQLFKKLKATKEQFKELFTLLGEYTPIKSDDSVKFQQTLSLPKEYIPLWEKQNTPDYKRAMLYLKKRNIDLFDIIKYGIGYCEDGMYSGRIIVPSFDDGGNLNYFVGRSFYDTKLKYKNPAVSKNIVGFDLFINWNEPIVLVEGVFDAIAIKRNAIPLFGKTIPDNLMRKIIQNKVKEIYLCLDKDALTDALNISQTLMNTGIRVGMVDLPDDTDPSSIGFEGIHSMLSDTDELTLSNLMRYKLWR